MLEIIAICTALAVGIACGWWLRGTEHPSLRLSVPAQDAAHTREMLQRLRELTQDVASDVDRHRALMGQVREELDAAAGQQPTAVLRAVDKLIQFNERMQQQLHTAEEKLQDQARQIVSHSAEAHTDPLTGLSNRRAFDRDLNRAYRAALDHGQPTVVMMIDVDHFKRLNDTYGHQAGDTVLRGIARVLRQHIPEEHLVARYGGEEFAAVFFDASVEEVELIAERARHAVGETRYTFDGLELHVTASAGLAQFAAGETAASLLGRADDALYVAKEMGRDRAHVHNGTVVVPVGTRPQRGGRAVAPATPPAAYDVGISSPEVFSSDLRQRLADWKSGGAPLCLLFVQIDDLEQIRQRHGDENCDAMLRALTLTLKANMREIDHAARFEGQALSLLLPGATLRGAVTAAERLRAAAARCELHPRYERRAFTISIGVAEALADENEQQLITRVRDSLTVAHMHGRDCTYVHDGFDFHLVGVGTISVAS